MVVTVGGRFGRDAEPGAVMRDAFVVQMSVVEMWLGERAVPARLSDQ
jgi:hypothetical protein